MSELCPTTVLGCAEFYSRRHVPKHLDHMREDIAADATLRVIESTSRGIPVSKHMWRWAVIDAIRHLCGNRRTVTGRARSSALHNNPDALIEETNGTDVAWCVTRLTAVWPNLTPAQQASVQHWLIGERTPGMHPSAACRARAAAFERIRTGEAPRKQAA